MTALEMYCLPSLHQAENVNDKIEPFFENICFGKCERISKSNDTFSDFSKTTQEKFSSLKHLKY